MLPGIHGSIIISCYIMLPLIPGSIRSSSKPRSQCQEEENLEVGFVLIAHLCSLLICSSQLSNILSLTPRLRAAAPRMVSMAPVGCQSPVSGSLSSSWRPTPAPWPGASWAPAAPLYLKATSRISSPSRYRLSISPQALLKLSFLRLRVSSAVQLLYIILYTFMKALHKCPILYFCLRSSSTYPNVVRLSVRLTCSKKPL